MNTHPKHLQAAAFHVAAVAALNTVLKEPSAPVVIATIKPGERSLGYVQFGTPTSPMMTTDELRKLILVQMAGDIAVVELTGDRSILPSSGRFESAIRLCQKFVEATEPTLVVDELAQRVDTVFLGFVEEVRTVVRANRDNIQRVAEALLAKESLTQSDIATLIQ